MTNLPSSSSSFCEKHRRRLCEEDVTEDTAKLYAARNYRSHGVQTFQEFEEDFRRFTSVKRLIFRYLRCATELQGRLLLNHIVTLSNVFGIYPTTKILLLEHPHVAWPALVTCLDHLSILPQTVKYVRGEEVDLSRIPFDTVLIRKLFFDPHSAD